MPVAKAVPVSKAKPRPPQQPPVAKAAPVEPPVAKAAPAAGGGAVREADRAGADRKLPVDVLLRTGHRDEPFRQSTWHRMPPKAL